MSEARIYNPEKSNYPPSVFKKWFGIEILNDKYLILNIANYQRQLNN